jgi:putative ABC transport system substrate-binding protein
MKRRECIALLGAAAAWPLVARAQDAGRLYRLGMMLPFPRGARESFGIVDGMIDELRRNGFAEGQNLQIEFRAWAPHPELVSDYAADLAARPLDVIAVGGPLAVRAVQKATKSIPILAITDDMIGEGVIQSMARPDGNTTGVSILATELDGKRQEILIEVVPGARQIAALADVHTTPSAQIETLQAAAKARNIGLSIHRVEKAAEIEKALEAAKASGAAALNVLASPMLFSSHQMIVERVAGLRLPAMFQ